MSKGHHGRGFHQIKKKKKSKRHQATPIAQQPIVSQTVESTSSISAAPVEERVIETISQVEKPVEKKDRNTAMMADLKMVVILAVIMLVVLIVLVQVMG